MEIRIIFGVIVNFVRRQLNRSGRNESIVAIGTFWLPEWKVRRMAKRSANNVAFEVEEGTLY